MGTGSLPPSGAKYAAPKPISRQDDRKPIRNDTDRAETGERSPWQVTRSVQGEGIIADLLDWSRVCSLFAVRWPLSVAGSTGEVPRSDLQATTLERPLAAPRQKLATDHGPPTNLFLRRRVSAADFVPVERVPPGCDVVGSPVLIFEIIGMFPDVKTEERGLAFHDRAILIG